MRQTLEPQKPWREDSSKIKRAHRCAVRYAIDEGAQDIFIEEEDGRAGWPAWGDSIGRAVPPCPAGSCKMIPRGVGISQGSITNGQHAAVHVYDERGFI